VRVGEDAVAGEQRAPGRGVAWRWTLLAVRQRGEQQRGGRPSLIERVRVVADLTRQARAVPRPSVALEQRERHEHSGQRLRRSARALGAQREHPADRRRALRGFERAIPGARVRRHL
jgi:hypothetical protein